MAVMAVCGGLNSDYLCDHTSGQGDSAICLSGVEQSHIYLCGCSNNGDGIGGCSDLCPSISLGLPQQLFLVNRNSWNFFWLYIRTVKTEPGGSDTLCPVWRAGDFGLSRFDPPA